mmetsp:Transcript_1873/g.3961  ORF Transcript_1873/g.3961 Transcript_1873/m.3961 type:complete len:274 (-) Transcript_1873:1739-2560(-)
MSSFSRLLDALGDWDRFPGDPLEGFVPAVLAHHGPPRRTAHGNHRAHLPVLRVVLVLHEHSITHAQRLGLRLLGRRLGRRTCIICCRRPSSPVRPLVCLVWLGAEGGGEGGGGKVEAVTRRRAANRFHHVAGQEHLSDVGGEVERSRLRGSPKAQHIQGLAGVLHCLAQEPRHGVVRGHGCALEGGAQRGRGDSGGRRPVHKHQDQVDRRRRLAATRLVLARGLDLPSLVLAGSRLVLGLAEQRGGRGGAQEGAPPLLERPPRAHGGPEAPPD